MVVAGENRVRRLVGVTAAPELTRKLVQLLPVALEALRGDARAVLPVEPERLELMSRAVAGGVACSLMDAPLQWSAQFDCGTV